MTANKVSEIILIVDDNPVNLEVLLNTLTNAGFEVGVAIDGESAIRQSEYEPPDLILLDVLLPGIDGFETCRQLKENPLTKDIPVIFMTSLSDTTERVKGLNLGAIDYITKPFHQDEILARINVHLKLRYLSKKLEKQNQILKQEISERIAAQTALQKLNEELEQRVQERTADLSRALRELQENESKLAQFLEAIPVGVTVLDAEGKTYYGNRIFVQLFGPGSSPQVPSEQFSDISKLYITGTEQEYPSIQLPGIRALKGESIRIDNLEIHQDNKIIPLEAWGTPIYDQQGKITYAIGVFQDITDRKKAEIERQRFTKELFQLNQAYQRFVPSQFLQLLKKSSIIDVQLGDQVQLEMSVLFSDIRDFTTLSETMTPEENFKFINSYLSRMEPAITAHYGFIDKYIGDAIMALFSGDADNPVKASISMLQKLSEYNQHRINQGYVPISIGIGINTGSLMLGTVGGQNRMDSTVISDAVNLASRIEGLTKNYGVSLLISESTFARLQEPERYAIRVIDTVQVKGKFQRVTVYEVFDADPMALRESKLNSLPIFTEALSLYRLNQFSAAAELFAQCLAQTPQDKVAQIYLQRCEQKSFDETLSRESESLEL